MTDKLYVELQLKLHLMNSNFEIRNFIHNKYNLHTNFNLNEYKHYLTKLKEIGVTEIEHAGSNLTYFSQKTRLKDVIDINHDLGLKFVFYTGVFGTENIRHNKQMEKWVQRNKNGNLLSYENAGTKSAMMCPASSYVDEVTIPYLLEIINTSPIDKMFFDIPWIMPNGCYCSNCHKINQKELSKEIIVRKALKKIVKTIKDYNQNIKIGVNAGAPTIHNNKFSGAHIDNLKGIFDEYITEWNPYRWNQNVKNVSRCIKYAKNSVQGTLLHATTFTDKKGKMYSKDKYIKLFSAIIKEYASPRLGISFPEEQLRVIGDAWKTAQNNLFLKNI